MPVSKKRKPKGKKNTKTVVAKPNKQTPKPFNPKLLEQIKKTGIDFEIHHGEFKHKVSELILAYGKDLVGVEHEYEYNKKMVGILIICWNIGAQKEDREKATKDFIESGKLQELEGLIRDLIDRKIKYFSQYKYLILSYDLAFQNGRLQLNVASTEIE